MSISISLSVIIPTYKRTDSLKRLLQLLQQQTLVNIEVLVIDQNEKGFLENAISISGFSNVRQIFQQQPNASSARNNGAVNANSKYLLFLDDDLVPEKDFCEQGIKLFTKYDFVSCFTPWIKNELDASSDSLAGILKVVDKPADHLFEIIDTMSAALFFTKEAFLRSGGFDPLLFDFAKTAEDQEFFLRLKFKNIKLYYTDAFSIFHDEGQAGGCDLRTVDYWITREKCMRAWIYRYKIHRGGNLKLTTSDYINLYRSVFINRSGLNSGISIIKKQISLFNKAKIETTNYLNNYKKQYFSTKDINHLNK